MPIANNPRPEAQLMRGNRSRWKLCSTGCTLLRGEHPSLFRGVSTFNTTLLSRAIRGWANKGRTSLFNVSHSQTTFEKTPNVTVINHFFPFVFFYRESISVITFFIINSINFNLFVGKIIVILHVEYFSGVLLENFERQLTFNEIATNNFTY